MALSKRYRPEITSSIIDSIMAIVVEDKNIQSANQHFISLFGLEFGQINGRRGEALRQLRQAAIERLGALAFPTRRDEDWKYTSMARALQPKYRLPSPVILRPEQTAPYRYASINPIRLTFVNGILAPELSDMEDLPAGVTMRPIAEAMEEEAHRQVVERYFGEWVREEQNAFLALNVAFARHGVFLHVRASTAVERPIHLLHLTVPGHEPLLLTSQLLLVAEQNSEITILESYRQVEGSAGEPCLISVANRFVVHANAAVRHYKTQDESAENFMVNNTVVDQHRDSAFHSFAGDFGGRIVRNNLSALLHDQNTLTNLYGVFVGVGEQHIDNQTFIDHAFPHCQSNELYKGILADSARGVFNGKVMVRPDAQKTNAFQQNSALVLSETAQMDAKPQLEIFADDVRCSHGATIGQLEEDAVFYLRSRGLNDGQARSLLQHAFIREAIDFISLDLVREMVDELATRKFAGRWTA
jgi:Fe-S cluster assembly protein SufD